MTGLFSLDESKIEFDISCNNSLAVKISELLLAFQSVNEGVSDFLLFLKIWAKSQDFGSRLTSYSITLLAIVYLQIEKLLPSVKSLQKKVPQKLARFWNVNFSQPAHHESAWPTPIELLSGFFGFCQDLKPDLIVSPYLGSTLPTSYFVEESKSLKKIMPAYTYNVFKRGMPNFRVGQLNIQDPFELNLNVYLAFSQLNCEQRRLGSVRRHQIRTSRQN